MRRIVLECLVFFIGLIALMALAESNGEETGEYPRSCIKLGWDRPIAMAVLGISWGGLTVYSLCFHRRSHPGSDKS